MAKATFVTAKPVKQPPNKVILELTEGEADLIYFLTGRVTGSDNSPRKYATRVFSALADALGIMSSQTDAAKLFMHGHGPFTHFIDYPAERADSQRYVIP